MRGKRSVVAQELPAGVGGGGGGRMGRELAQLPLAHEQVHMKRE